MNATKVNVVAPLKPLDQALFYAVRYGLCFVFAIPFIVLLNYLYPWVSGKVWGFELMVEILFPLWVLLAMRRREFRPATNPFFWALLAYFAIATISMIFGDMPNRSLWSKPDRLTGMFFQYHLLAFFFMASTAWRGFLTKAAAISVTVAVVSALYGFGQASFGMGGGDGSTRGSAAFGNPDYLGQFLVPHVFLAAWLLWRNRGNYWRVFCSLGLVALFLGIVATGSRGALLGLVLATLVGLVIVAVKNRGRLQKAMFIGLAVLAVLGLAYLGANKWRPTATWLYNHRYSIQFIQESTGSRSLLITNAIKGIEERPILGWGPENFESAYYFYYDPVTIKFSDYETRQDHPHNLILDILVSIGLVGFLAYALVFFFGWRGALKRQDEDRFVGLALVLALVGHLATNTFIFETTTSYVNLFVMLALLAVFIAPQVEGGEDPETHAAAVPLAIIVAALVIWVSSYAVVNAVRASAVTAKAVVGLSDRSIQPADLSALVVQLKSIPHPLYERDIRALASNLSAGRGEYVTDNYKTVLKDLATVEYKLAPSQQHDYVNALVTATALQSLPPPRTTEEQSALDEAINRAVKLAPNRQEVYWLVGQNEFEKGDLDAANQAFQKALDLYPDSLSAQAAYAGFLLRAGQVPAAMARLKDSWSQIKDNSEASAWVTRPVVLMMDQGRFDEMIQLYQSAQSLNMMTFEWSIAGALGAISKGDVPLSEKIISDMRQNYPDKSDLIDKYVVPQLDALKSSLVKAPAPSGK
jgi:O-antigen ligase/tetratricopeptide (TPR) repeat protein